MSDPRTWPKERRVENFLLGCAERVDLFYKRNAMRALPNFPESTEEVVRRILKSELQRVGLISSR